MTTQTTQEQETARVALTRSTGRRAERLFSVWTLATGVFLETRFLGLLPYVLK